MRSRFSRQFGQGMTEYIIIVALIAVAAIGIYGLFGDTIRKQMGIMTEEIGGTHSGIKTDTSKAADKSKEATLKDFNKGTQ